MTSAPETPIELPRQDYGVVEISRTLHDERPYVWVDRLEGSAPDRRPALFTGRENWCRPAAGCRVGVESTTAALATDRRTGDAGHATSSAPTRLRRGGDLHGADLRLQHGSRPRLQITKQTVISILTQSAVCVLSHITKRFRDTADGAPDHESGGGGQAQPRGMGVVAGGSPPAVVKARRTVRTVRRVWRCRWACVRRRQCSPRGGGG
jgi:hypothetical protein